MIKIKNDWVKIDGDIVTIMSELTIAIKGTYELLTRNFGDVIARECIAKAGRLAFASEDEIKAERDELRRKVNEQRSTDR